MSGVGCVATLGAILRYMRRIGHYVLCIHDYGAITVLATGDIQRSERQQRAGLCTTQRRQIMRRYMVPEQKQKSQTLQNQAARTESSSHSKSSGHYWNLKGQTDNGHEAGQRQNSKNPCGENLRGTTPAK